jgi:hypothetical protein
MTFIFALIVSVYLFLELGKVKKAVERQRLSLEELKLQLAAEKLRTEHSAQAVAGSSSANVSGSALGVERMSGIAQVTSAGFTGTSQVGQSDVVSMAPPPAPPAPSGPGTIERLLQWLATDWLLKLGAGLVLLGLGWFVSYAFAENWIGPVGRITLGLLLGSSILVVGELRGRVSAAQASVLMALGAATVLLTTYAARAVYGFFDPLSAVGLMFVSVVFVAISSVRHIRPERAVLGFFLAVLIPFLTASASSSAFELMSYFILVSAGTLWVISLTGWRELFLLTSVTYLAYSFMSIFSAKESDWWLVLVIVGLSVMLYAVSLVLHIRLTLLKPMDFLPPILNALILVMWAMVLLPDHLQSVAMSLVALVFFLGTYVLFVRSRQTVLVLEYAGIAMALLAAAAAFELEGPVLIVTHSVLVSVAMLLSWIVTKKPAISQKVGLLFLLVLLQLFTLLGSITAQRERLSYSQELEQMKQQRALYEEDLYGNADGYYGGKYIEPAQNRPTSADLAKQELEFWVVLALVTLQVILAGYLFYKKAKLEHDADSESWAAVYLVGSLVLALYWIWFGLEMAFAGALDTAHAFALVVFTMIGLAGYIFGRLNRYRKTMLSGAGVLALVVLRLLFVEIYGMELFEKVVVFLLIGALLMGAAFIKPPKEKGAAW